MPVKEGQFDGGHAAEVAGGRRSLGAGAPQPRDINIMSCILGAHTPGGGDQ